MARLYFCRLLHKDSTCQFLNVSLLCESGCIREHIENFTDHHLEIYLGIVYFSVIYVDFSVRTSVNANDLMQWMPPRALLELLRCRFTLLFTNFGSCCVALDAVMLHLAELQSDVYICSFIHSNFTAKLH